MNGVREALQSPQRFAIAAALVGLFGAALRALYVATAHIETLVYGDGLQYTVYALNLIHHGVFSSSPPGGELVPDSYRAPGFPLLLAGAVSLAGNDVELGMRYAQWLQVLIGAASVLVSIALARLWLERGWALLVGLLVACWPHLITFAATVMSETLYGFCLLLACWLLCLAERREHVALMCGAGVAFGAAYLVNPIMVFFPLLAAVLLFRRGRRQLAAALLATALLAPAAWGWRNAHLTSNVSEFHHAVDGLVWGSSPLYLPAFNSRWVSPEAQRLDARAHEEANLLVTDPAAGVAAILERMKQDPLVYLSWYLLEKPYLLWDWSIVIGNGDIYYPVTRSSPFERIAMLHWMKQLLQWMNPALFALAIAGAFYHAGREVRRPGAAPFVAAVTALLVLYVTALHALLTAEPRYALPYRPEQLLLAVGVAAGLVAVLRRRRGGSAAASAA